MKTILLCCAAGMSTSMLVQRMQAEAEKRGLEVAIKAVPALELEMYINEADVILLGPQIKYELPRFTALAEPLGKPISLIETMDYGALRGDKVLDHALSLLE
ncbi:PTS sugar transporter subunit IIB [Xenorhabdus bovienii]|uniref:PTS sugar transporter subunit IIB n=1 Tax=Xenorhabdus bovienii TaxID=40576 RepID=UPI0023B33907|nr:PTS sugar transporter subunit IIB [Xenorhabdus bovienii]MDE9436654.1 PTS sugar transporter subunit IIB [Xenorhabdus bovienii]MDE9498123.1 PTS sugar transporter subunit IIB [Xenorhabdus bovienii]